MKRFWGIVFFLFAAIGAIARADNSHSRSFEKYGFNSTQKKSSKSTSGVSMTDEGPIYVDPSTEQVFEVLFDESDGHMVLRAEGAKKTRTPSRNVIRGVLDLYRDSNIEVQHAPLMEKFETWADEQLADSDSHDRPPERQIAERRPRKGNHHSEIKEEETTEEPAESEREIDSESERNYPPADLVRVPPILPWDSQFNSFAANNANFNISIAPMQTQMVGTGLGAANLLPDGFRDPRDILYIVDGTTDTAARSYVAHFTAISGGSNNVCLVLYVDPDLENCVDKFVQYRARAWNITPELARKNLETVVAGHGWDGHGGRLSLGGGNWTVHPNKSFGAGEPATYKFLANMTKKGYEFTNVTMFACDTGRGTTNESVAGAQKLFAMLPGNPVVRAYDGTVLTSAQYTAVQAGRNEVTIQVKPDLTSTADLASLNGTDNQGTIATY